MNELMKAIGWEANYQIQQADQGAIHYRSRWQWFQHVVRGIPLAQCQLNAAGLGYYSIGWVGRS